MAAKKKFVRLDAGKFQEPLASLTLTLSLKVQREGRKLLPKPAFITHDIYTLIAQAGHTYDLFFYLNADEKRHKEAGWRMAYGIVTLPLIRCMIDCLYNVTAMLDNPARAYAYRLSGYKKALGALDADEKRYGGDQDWDNYIAKQRDMLDLLLRHDGLKKTEVQVAKMWPTLSAYLRIKKTTPFTLHQRFLKELTYGFWQEYSALAHGTYDGLLSTAWYYVPKDLPHDERPKIEDAYERMIFMHLSRMAAVLLCMLTEVQAYFKFDGANINKRLHDVWKVLRRVPEIKDLYNERYKKLMKDNGINPT